MFALFYLKTYYLNIDLIFLFTDWSSIALYILSHVLTLDVLHLHSQHMSILAIYLYLFEVAYNACGAVMY